MAFLTASTDQFHFTFHLILTRKVHWPLSPVDAHTHIYTNSHTHAQRILFPHRSLLHSCYVFTLNFCFVLICSSIAARSSISSFDQLIFTWSFCRIPSTVCCSEFPFIAHRCISSRLILDALLLLLHCHWHCWERFVRTEKIKQTAEKRKVCNKPNYCRKFRVHCTAANSAWR